VRTAARTNVQDDAVEDEPPQQTRHFDYARVRQKFFQVATDGLRAWFVGCAEIDQQYTNGVGFAVGEAWGAMEAAHGVSLKVTDHSRQVRRARRTCHCRCAEMQYADDGVFSGETQRRLHTRAVSGRTGLPHHAEA